MFLIQFSDSQICLFQQEGLNILNKLVPWYKEITKISNFNLKIRIEKNILRFYVSMSDTLFMHKFKGVYNLMKKCSSYNFWKTASRENKRKHFSPLG